MSRYFGKKQTTVSTPLALAILVIILISIIITVWQVKNRQEYRGRAQFIPQTTSTLYLSPKTISTQLGSTFTVEIRENSEQEPVTAVEATLVYPSADLLMDHIDMNGSPFTQTTEQLLSPGVIRLIRKSNDPILSDALVATVTFKLKKPKSGIEFSPESSIKSAVSGNNILNNAYGASVNAETQITADTKNIPVVLVTSPKNKTIITAGTTQVLYADVSDKSGISVVEFFVNDARICKKTTYPYTCDWKVPGAASRVYTIEAKATNKLNKTGTNKIFVYTN